ncbi:MAG: hypothetical protein ACM3ZE_04430, partial [Myxococcales bacterium]
ESPLASPVRQARSYAERDCHCVERRRVNAMGEFGMKRVRGASRLVQREPSARVACSDISTPHDAQQVVVDA